MQQKVRLKFDKHSVINTYGNIPKCDSIGKPDREQHGPRPRVQYSINFANFLNKQPHDVPLGFCVTSRAHLERDIGLILGLGASVVAHYRAVISESLTYVSKFVCYAETLLPLS